MSTVAVQVAVQAAALVVDLAVDVDPVPLDSPWRNGNDNGSGLGHGHGHEEDAGARPRHAHDPRYSVPMSERTAPRLGDLVPAGGTEDPDRILDLFLGWVEGIGFDLYPAQEEALLELMADRHVILSTPTGSGKSLVALGVHFRALCERRTSFYTSPVKALASEKFFALCDELGADNVGMLTGDASINPEATVLCCTAEVLANMALRRGAELDASFVVMDEFHYYGDAQRGAAWQIPLITLPHTRFLLMSATLGETSQIAEHLRRQTDHEVATVTSAVRPVPLDFTYRETPIHETVEWLVEGYRSPIYVVNFTQRECAELAQSLTSKSLTSKDDKERIREAIAGARFDTPYGRELRRFLGFGIGVHHAGLLPKYRLLVEQLSQQGLLKVVSGTDTLGVGVNIPIRTVLFTALAKYDGRAVSILKVRDFKQIAGRAGRKGFDDQGSVVCQAPEHEVERLQAQRKAAGDPKKKRKLSKKPTEKGVVSWTRDTFSRLIEQPPEQLRPRMSLTSGMILDLLQRDTDANDPTRGNFHSLRQLIRDCHQDAATKQRLLGRAAQLVRSLYRIGVIGMERDVASRYLWVTVNDELQVDFSLFHNLSLFLVEVTAELDPADPEYALVLLSLAESVIEDPDVILHRQQDRLKQELLARLKAEGVSYEERVARLDEVTYPQPCLELLQDAFERFRADHPWVGAGAFSPKGIGRELYEGYASFADYVVMYGLQRSEGLLLRYLSQLYKTLQQNVPDRAKTEAVHDLIGYFRAMLERVDTSLIEEWEVMRHPELILAGPADAHAAHRALALEELVGNRRALSARIRAEIYQLVRALSRQDWDEAASCVRQHTGDPASEWSAERIAAAMAPFFAAHETLVFDHQARLADKTVIRDVGDRRYEVTQVLVDPQGDNLWHLRAAVELTRPESLDEPFLALLEIGT